MYLVRMYRDEFNYNVMVPDLQYFGYSEGEAAQMGWLDRLDVEDWAAVAHDIFKDDFTVVHGVSMGAATAMMMSGDDLPPYIRAFVEDCGYSSASAPSSRTAATPPPGTSSPTTSRTASTCPRSRS